MFELVYVSFSFSVCKSHFNQLISYSFVTKLDSCFDPFDFICFVVHFLFLTYIALRFFPDTLTSFMVYGHPSFFNQPVSFMIAPNFTYSWLATTMPISTFYSRFPSSVLGSFPLTILLLELRFFLICFAQPFSEACKDCIFTVSKVKLATIVEGDPKAPFSIATTPRCRGGRYSIPWIAPLYPWTVPYNAEC